VHIVSMICDCTVSTVLVVHILDNRALLFSVMTFIVVQSEANFAVILHI